MVGRTVSHYEIIEQIGAGGMGVVYKARDTQLDRIVALKFLPPHLSADLDEKHRFLHEARAASALDHPNIGVVHEVGETSDGQMFIAMAYYPGETLKQRIAAASAAGETLVDKVATGLPVSDAVDIALQIARGLARAHAQGFVHRDIKPGNIIYTKDGVAKIIDFGLAKVSEATATLVGTTKGTAAYMSPEQALGQAVDAGTDVWSLGVVLYEMLAGELPFRGQHAGALVRAITQDSPKPLREVRPEASEDLDHVISRALQKDSARRYASGVEMERDLADYLARTSAPVAAPADWKSVIARPKVLAPAAVLILALAALAGWLLQRASKARWAREQALPEITRLAGKNDFWTAYSLARQAEQSIPNDAALKKLWDEISYQISVRTDPPGALVEVIAYNAGEGSWLNLGPSPISKARIPRGYIRWRVSKAGFGAMLGARHSVLPLEVKLEPEGTTPAGMVRLPAGTFQQTIGQVGTVGPYSLDAYFIDQYEVTNRQFQEFVDKGGYQNPDFWKHKFVRDGHELSREAAVGEFRDLTGRPGPATWEAGRFPNGQAEFPIGGVSWFEAVAYCEFAGKSLPTLAHWSRAADRSAAPLIVPASNFSGTAPAPVGKYQGISPFGAYDMAGNVKEWLWNEAGGGMHFILGGSFRDQPYQFNDADARSPFDRSPVNGVRCALYGGPLAGALTAPIVRSPRDYSKEKPASDEVFRQYRRLYAYDRTDLNPKMESADDGSEHWRKEKVSFDAAYGSERVPVHIFIPKSARPPFHAVVFCPGANAFDLSSSDTQPAFNRLDFIVKSGRVVVCPVYIGMYERRFLRRPPAGTIQHRDLITQFYKDLARTVDYLETRHEIDRNKLAYMGVSYGSAQGVVWSSLEERFKAIVYIDGGLPFASRPLPEADVINFAPRMRAPVLMLNGRHDFTFPVEDSQKQLFRLLGMSEKDKRHVLFDTAHDVSLNRAEMMREVLGWLDKYLGKVQ